MLKESILLFIPASNAGSESKSSINPKHSGMAGDVGRKKVTDCDWRKKPKMPRGCPPSSWSLNRPMVRNHVNLLFLQITFSIHYQFHQPFLKISTFHLKKSEKLWNMDCH